LIIAWASTLTFSRMALLILSIPFITTACLS
jgi:hypothetical protein